MKSKILKTFLFFAVFSTLLITASFATTGEQVKIKEDTSMYNTNIHIIGSTRIDTEMTITASVAATAGLNEAKVKIALGEDISNLKIAIYTYDTDFEEWNEINEDGTIRLLTSESEIQEIENNLNIFFVNNEVKTLEVKYDGNVDKDSLPSNVEYKDGSFFVPATTFNFTFEDSNGVENTVNTNVDTNIKEGKEPTIEDVDIIPEWANFEINGEYYSVDGIDEVFASKEELEVKVLKDTDLKTAVVVSSKVTLDLNGCVLTAKKDTEGNGIFWVKTDGDLTINGEGTIDSACQTNDYSMAIWATGTGKVTINGGTYTNVGAKDFEDNGTTPNNNELIYANGSGKITINDGMFIGNINNRKYGAQYTLNLKDKSEATITVNGGTFIGYNPANSASENPRMNFLADGHKVVLEANEYTVEKVEETDMILADGMVCEDLQTAVNDALRVKLLKDIDLPTAVEVTTKVTLDLNGKTLTAKKDTEGNGIFWVKTGGDLTINGEGTIDSACQTNDYSMAIWATGEGKVTINGGTYTNVGAKDFEDDGITPNNNELIYANGSAKIVINGGKFTGNTENETYEARYTLNLKDNSNATITVKGGTFTGYDPANSKSENPTANLVAEGYEVTVENDIYTVVEKAN